MSTLNIILNFRKTARSAFNVLVGALETCLPDGDFHISRARNQRELEQLVQHHDADRKTVVLWSFYSTQFNDVREQLEQIRQLDNNIIHIAGGVHASAEPQQTLQAGFDYVAIGEGEQIIVDLISNLLQKSTPDKVKGIACMNNNTLLRNGRGELVELDDYPPFAPRHRLFGAIEITRGCIYACKFCQTPYVSKARFRHRSIDNIIYYTRLMRARGYRDYRFISPTSLSYGSPDESVNLDAVEQLLSGMRETVGHNARIFFGTFPSEIRPEHISIKALRILKKYVDNDNLIIGGQSGSQHVLDTSKRGHSVESITRAAELCLREGFLPNVDFLYGLPGETHDDIRQTMQLVQKLTDMGARIHSHTFMPLPGTPFRDAGAGQVDDEIQQCIINMESLGKAYGKWKSQIQTARELVTLRNENT